MLSSPSLPPPPVHLLSSTSRPAAKDVAQRLTRVVASSKLLRKALLKHAAGAGGGRAATKAANGAASADGGGGIAAVLKTFTRGLKTVAAVAEPESSPLIAAVKEACCEFGGEVSADVVRRAARFLLESLESLGGVDEVRRRG